MNGTVNGTLNGLILCRDERLCRLLETELGYLSVKAASCQALPPPDGNTCILLLDGDGFAVSDGVSWAEACGCPLLVFGREPAELPRRADRAVYLRRPFALTELEKTVRLLLADRPLTGIPAGIFADISAGTPAGTPTLPIARDDPPAAPALTAKDGTVTVGDRSVTLTPAEWDIFEYLYTRRGEAVPREELSALLGGGGNSVDVYVCHLRSKIEKPLGRRMIWTVRGVGYRMEDNI